MKNLGDKFNKTITIRISELQFSYLTKMADIIGCNPSEFLRLLIDSNMYKNVSSLENNLEENKEEL